MLFRLYVLTSVLVLGFLNMWASIAAQQGAPPAPRTMVWVDRAGNEEPLSAPHASIKTPGFLPTAAGWRWALASRAPSTSGCAICPPAAI